MIGLTTHIDQSKLDHSYGYGMHFFVESMEDTNLLFWILDLRKKYSTASDVLSFMEEQFKVENNSEEVIVPVVRDISIPSESPPNTNLPLEQEQTQAQKVAEVLPESVATNLAPDLATELVVVKAKSFLQYFHHF